jgi:DNA polymerase I
VTAPRGVVGVRRHNADVVTAVVSDGAGGGWWQECDSDGEPVGPTQRVADLAADVIRQESGTAPRWLWSSTVTAYPPLLRAGVRVGRCHDLELTEALLLGYAGRWGEPRSVAAILARRARGPVPPDPVPMAARPPGEQQDSLFELPGAQPYTTAQLLVAYGDQQERIAATEHPERFRLLVAAESAGALVAAEMGHDGLPWRADVHDRILAELLGARTPGGGMPGRLAQLSLAIAEALDAPGLHPDSPTELRRAFARVGIALADTRSWSLRGVDHPAVPLVREFKELYRVWTAHGWSWCDTWVHQGRFRPEYVPGGVVSGRWATRGGGALQIPRVIRGAVVADAGWRLIVADAGQLEPRVLAAVSGDAGLTAAAATGDLYAALAAESFGSDRGRAKLALLGAMYGQVGGAALPAIAVLKRRYPDAWEYVERAARIGSAGGLVRSWLGRTCPPAGRSLQVPEAARARGRFARNFVIQATAAEWALALLAVLRTSLRGHAAQLVFFQHDEVVVHCPAREAEVVTLAVHSAAEQAGTLLFGAARVRFPLDLAVVRCYGDA